MKILDIRFKNDKAYFLKEHGFTLINISEQIEKIRYNSVYDNYRQIKGGSEENRQFPSFIESFYLFSFLKSRIPEPKELIDYYFSENKGLLILSDNTENFTFEGEVFSSKALSARLLRSYPSIVRDFHFFILMTESKTFDEVVYSLKNDINGCDLTVKHKGIEYDIALRTDTYRSNFYKKIKDRFRHRNIKNHKVIDVPLKLGADTYSYGDTYMV